MKPILLLALILLSAGSALAGGKTITYYSDGALVELEATAVKGSAVIPLPGGMVDNSLRIRPLDGAVIRQVDIQAFKREGKAEKELDGLLERRNRLQDRLLALATREEIFTSAAKSQSAKAPRKTKANPDPLQSIRQGTDFAIAQLEVVYTARRKTVQEIRVLDARITGLRSSGAGAETVARVTVTPANGRIKARYAIAGQGWTPRYDLRLKGDGTAALTLFGLLPGSFAGYQQRAAAGTLAESDPDRAVSVAAGPTARLGEYILTSAEERVSSTVAGSCSALLTNRSSSYLPAGEAVLFLKDEYVGRFRFDGMSSGHSKQFSTAR